MAKDIKLYKDKEEITVNENNVDYYKSLGYTTEKKKKNKTHINQQHIRIKYNGNSSRKRRIN